MMPRLIRYSTASRLLLTLFLATSRAVSASLSFHKAGQFLKQGDSDIKSGDLRGAIGSYSLGMRVLPKRWSKVLADGGEQADERLPTKAEIKDIINLHTHYGQALYNENDNVGSEEVLEAFKRAIVCYRDWLSSSPEYYRDDPDVNQVAAKSYFFLATVYQELAERPEYTEKQENYLELAQKWFSQVQELDEEGEWTESIAKSYFFLGLDYQQLAEDSEETETREAHLEKALELYDASIEVDSDDWETYAAKGSVLAAVGKDEKGYVSLQEYDEGIATWETALYILNKKVLEKGDPEGYATPTASPSSGPKTENPKEVSAEILFHIGKALIPSIFEDLPTDDSNEKEGDQEKEKEEEEDQEKEDLSKKMCTLPGETKESKCLDLAVQQFQAALKFHPEHEGAKSMLDWIQMKDNEKKMAKINEERMVGLQETMKLMEEYKVMKEQLRMMKKVEGLYDMIEEVNEMVKKVKEQTADEGGEESPTSEGESDAESGKEGMSSEDDGDSMKESEEDTPSKDEL